MYKKIYKNMCFLSIFTLILTALILISAYYSIFFNRLKDELKNETTLIAEFLNSSVSPVNALQSLSFNTADKRISLISQNGNIIFDNNTEADSLQADTESPEVKQALSEGYGHSEKYSFASATNFYYSAIKLSNGEILHISTSTKTLFSAMMNVIGIMVFIASMIYVLSIIIAIRLTDNIVKPIQNVHSFDDKDIDSIYDEIKPFLQRIQQQNKEIKRQMKKIDSQKFRLMAITNNMNEGLIVLDKNKNVVSLNNFTINLFNADENNYRQKKLTDITSNEILIKAADKALEGCRNDTFIKIDDNTYQIFSSPVTENMITNGVVILLFDITDKADTELIRREFTANVSHELKTPLTTIHGFAQIITSGIAKSEDIIGFAKKIEKESSRLIVLIDDIIKLSRLDENVSDNKKETFSIKAVVDEVLDMLSTKAEERNIKFIVSDNDTLIYANPSQITEMIFNLCDNAIKYNNIGGTINIDISEKEISISDTGIGIPEKDIDRIFERFFRIDKSHSKKVNGTGLGLSIVKHIAQANNALIKVSSKINEGSKFTVKFQ